MNATQNLLFLLVITTIGVGNSLVLQAFGALNVIVRETARLDISGLKVTAVHISLRNVYNSEGVTVVHEQLQPIIKSTKEVTGFEHDAGMRLVAGPPIAAGISYNVTYDRASPEAILAVRSLTDDIDAHNKIKIQNNNSPKGKAPTLYSAVLVDDVTVPVNGNVALAGTSVTGGTIILAGIHGAGQADLIRAAIAAIGPGPVVAIGLRNVILERGSTLDASNAEVIGLFIEFIFGPPPVPEV